MKFVKYDGEIKRKSGHGRGRVQRRLDDFMSMNVKQAIVEFDEGEYKNIMYGYKGLLVAVKRYVLPIDVHIADGVVYLVRRDM